MKIRLGFILVLALTFLSVPTLWAAKSGELTLMKVPLYEITDGFQRGEGSGCDGFFYVKPGKNVPDLRRDFNYFHCEGRYSITLEGPKGKTATLFAGFKYGKKGGFIVIRKKDDKKVWIMDLMNFSSGKWVKKKANPDTGAYEVYYKKAAQFDQYIASIKWGKWWKGNSPK